MNVPSEFSQERNDTTSKPRQHHSTLQMYSQTHKARGSGGVSDFHSQQNERMLGNKMHCASEPVIQTMARGDNAASDNNSRSL